MPKQPFTFILESAANACSVQNSVTNCPRSCELAESEATGELFERLYHACFPLTDASRQADSSSITDSTS